MARINANGITLIRVCLAPFVVLAFFPETIGITIDIFTARMVAIVLMVVAELSDSLDGRIARSRFSRVTERGKILDPFADSFYRLTVFFIFSILGYLHPLLFLVFLGRDINVGYLRVQCALKEVVFSARNSGKTKAIIQATAIFAVMGVDIVRYGPWKVGENEFLNTIIFHSDQIIFYLLLAAAIFTFYSGIEYFLGARKILRGVVSS